MTRSIARAQGVVILVALVRLATQPGAQAPSQPPPVNQSDDPLLKAFRFRSIGPASMGGRIDDIAVVDEDPHIFYVGYATGGVWKTTNNGTTWTPIFDTYSVASVGDLAVSPSNPDILWVGTGEPNNRQSSSFGDGVYKSIDGGRTFTPMGLRETQTIARIVTHPRDPDVVYVAALGHLFGPNPERGVFKTVDGGKTWQRVAYVDEDTGFTDLVMDPHDPETLYAASYQRRRTPWGFNGGGPGSGLWKTTDGGRSWRRLEGNGLPAGPLGRIGIDVCRSKPNVVYAQIELTMTGGPGGGGGQPQADALPDPRRSGVWRSEDFGRTWRIVSNNNNRPMYYSQIRCDPMNDQIVYTMGAPLFKSVDGGRTFRVVGGLAHSDHHAMWINPRNNRHLLVGNDGGLDVSYDQGETWEFIDTMPVGQFYAVAVDMRRPYYICGGLQDNGSFCGPSQLRWSGPILNAHWYRIGGGDGMYVQIDPTDYTTVYVESQNGNMFRLDLKTGASVSIRPRPQRRPGEPGGGPPGGPPLSPNIVPELPEGEVLRFHWTTPLVLSPHNPRIVYTGAQRLFKSLDRGDTWTASPDLTKQIDRTKLPILGVMGHRPMHSKHDGTASYGTITTIAESPVQPGVLWVGTDDGNLQVSRDGGVTWTNVAPNVPGVPERAPVARVEPSRADADTCYVAFDAHELDDLNPYLFVTRDGGKTWTSIVSNLPRGPVNVIREDPQNPALLYVGTEFGLYLSLDGGTLWRRFMTGLPTVRVDDLVVHPRENDLIVGTHGRSLFVLDDLTPLQHLAGSGPLRPATTPPGRDRNGAGRVEPAQAEVYLFDVRPAVQWKVDAMLNRVVGAAKHFRGENLGPGTYIHYLLRAPVAGEVTLTVTDWAGRPVRVLGGTNEVGINRVRWDLRTDPPPRPQGAQAGPPPQGRAVAPGTYLVRLAAGGTELVKPVVVLDDVWLTR